MQGQLDIDGGGRMPGEHTGNGVRRRLRTHDRQGSGEITQIMRVLGQVIPELLGRQCARGQFRKERMFQDRPVGPRTLAPQTRRPGLGHLTILAGRHWPDLRAVRSSRKGIRVNGVAPGCFASETSGSYPPGYLDRFIGLTGKSEQPGSSRTRPPK